MTTAGRKYRYFMVLMLDSIRSARMNVWSCQSADYLRAMLPSACANYVGTIHDFFGLVDEYSGLPGGGLGDKKPRPKIKLWPRPEASPSETLRDMRLIAEGAMEAEEKMDQIVPEGEIVGLDAARMRARHISARQIVLGKFDIMAKDPSFWTEALEEEFRTYLEYFPKAE